MIGRFHLRLFVAAAAVLSISCESSEVSGPAGEDTEQIASVTITPDSAEVVAGVGVQTYTATVRDQSGQLVQGAVVTWSSTPQVTLSSTQGMSTTATGVSSGKATITATAGSVTKSATLVVKAAAAPSAGPVSLVVAMNGSVTQPAPGLLAAAQLGAPAAAIQSFGGGALGGGVASYQPGQAVAFDLASPAPGAGARSAGSAQGSVTVGADGSFTITPPAGFEGTFSFLFRLGNAAGHVDATVTVAVDGPPTVTSTLPADGATGVDPATAIEILFSEPVAVPTEALHLECPAGTSRPFTLAGTGTSKLVLTPNAPLPRGETCIVAVTGAQVHDEDAVDGPDAMTADHTFSFTVASTSAPRASDDYYEGLAGDDETVRAPGVLANDDLGAPAAALVSFGGGSLGGDVTDHAPGSSVPLPGGGSVRLDGDGTLSFSTPEDGGEYTFRYRLEGQSGTSDATVTISVDAPPEVTGSLPAPSAKGVPADAVITIYFSEPVIADAGAFSLTCPAGNAIGFTVSGSGSEMIVLTPAQPLPVNTTCRVGVDGSGVRDEDSIDPPDEMEGEHDFGFTVGEPPVAAADEYIVDPNTTLSTGAPGVLGNDQLGIPGAQVVSFGGGSLGGTVTSNVAGTSVSFGGTGSVNLAADGSLILTPPTDFQGTITFQYRVSNGATSDAEVTVQVDAPPAILSIFPANGATNVNPTTNIVVTFTEPVSVLAPSALICTISGARTIDDFIATGGPVVYTLDPIDDFAPGETCSGTIPASIVFDLDTVDPPENMVSDFFYSFTIAAPIPAPPSAEALLRVPGAAPAPARK